MKIGIIIGSIRQGRISDRLAKWVESETKKLDGVEVTMIDLVDYPLPLFAEPKSPQYDPDRKPTGVLGRYIEIIDKMDALIVVTPEYNRSYSSALKNALDYIGFELKRKPVMLVAHGSSGGAQAVSHLRGVFPGLVAVTSPVAVMVTGFLAEILDEDGQPTNKEGTAPVPTDALQRALDEFIWLAGVLSAARKDNT